jgi:pimeloyl-ACP methyl ester carboxylesterase
MKQIELRIDVSEAVGLGETVTTMATVCLPDRVPERPIVAFAFPGGGYTRRYYTLELPDQDGHSGGQAGWHTSRGWIFVAVDHLSCGDSSRVSDPALITYEHMVAANEGSVRRVLDLLASGTLADELGPVTDPVLLGLGHSMGGATLILQQGQFATFHGVGVLGWSAVHSVSWTPPGAPRSSVRYFPRGTDMGALTPEVFTSAMPEMALDERGLPATTKGFHYDDEPESIVHRDMHDYPNRGGNLPPWGTSAIPPCAMTMMSPGAVAPEAASITVPVLIAVGERDICVDPMSEPRAYERASDISVYVCPRMAHMHNFARTRRQLWARVQAWGDGAVSLRQSSHSDSVSFAGV